jgi:hypothetical protein
MKKQPTNNLPSIMVKLPIRGGYISAVGSPKPFLGPVEYPMQSLLFAYLKGARNRNIDRNYKMLHAKP